MKKQILKKLTAFIIVSMMFSISTNAQIVYTDVNPDSTLACFVASGSCYQTFHLDLNSDGSIDFDLAHGYSRSNYGAGMCSYYYLGYSCYVYPYQNAIASDSIGALSLDSSLAINGGLSWRDTSYIGSDNNILASYSFHSVRHCPPSSPATSSSKGNWSNQTNKYLGLKIIKNGLSYYGWVRIAIVGFGASITIKDYAYNSIPNQPLLAGETTCATPTVNLTKIGSLSFCNGDSVTFTANGTGYQYQWKKNNVNIAGATSKTYVAKTAGVYKCKVTNSCGSKTSGTKTVIVNCRMLNDNVAVELEHLSVYPNPATNSVTIKFPSDQAGEMQIVNLFGQIVFSEKINSEEAQIDVSKFSAGMYVVKWSSGENNETKTFSVIK